MSGNIWELVGVGDLAPPEAGETIEASVVREAKFAVRVARYAPLLGQLPESRVARVLARGTRASSEVDSMTGFRVAWDGD
jgi:hypothetical protein